VIEIRSYRRVFDLERRIYSVDRLRLSPGGVPVRAVLYFLVFLLAGLMWSTLPLLGELARALPWYLRDIAMPGTAATVLSAIRLEGRTFHLAAHALVRHFAGPRRVSGFKRCGAGARLWRPPQIVLLPDGSDSRLRRLRYSGPGAVLVTVTHERRGRATEHGSRGAARPGLRPVLTLQPALEERAAHPGRVIAVGTGARLLVTPGRRGGR
jgi:hypothetical protein